jgi:hypothetical protein
MIQIYVTNRIHTAEAATAALVRASSLAVYRASRGRPKRVAFVVSEAIATNRRKVMLSLNKL